MKDDENSMDKFILYNTADGKASIKLYAESNTVWLTQAQIAILFNTKPQAIIKHIGNIYSEGELLEDSTCSKMEQVRIADKNKKSPASRMGN